MRAIRGTPPVTRAFGRGARDLGPSGVCCQQAQRLAPLPATARERRVGCAGPGIGPAELQGQYLGNWFRVVTPFVFPALRL